MGKHSERNFRSKRIGRDRRSSTRRGHPNRDPPSPIRLEEIRNSSEKGQWSDIDRRDVTERELLHHLRDPDLDEASDGSGDEDGADESGAKLHGGED